MEHTSTADLHAALDHIRRSPATDGTLEMIVRRPDVDQREVLEEGKLSLDEGLVGDSWRARPCGRTEDGTAHPDMQLNVINARLIDVIAGGRERWPLAGDQLYVDLDLSHTNLPAGTRLALGSAIIEVTEHPHRGCAKFSKRYGLEALRFVNSPVGRQLRLRGLNACVVRPGAIRRGDGVIKLG